MPPHLHGLALYRCTGVSAACRLGLRRTCQSIIIPPSQVSTECPRGAMKRKLHKGRETVSLPCGPATLLHSTLAQPALGGLCTVHRSCLRVGVRGREYLLSHGTRLTAHGPRPFVNVLIPGGCRQARGSDWLAALKSARN